MAVEWEVLDTIEAVGPTVVQQWDALAVRLDKPYCAPGWILPWHHVAPPGARLRIVVVRDDDELLAIAPFYAEPWRLRMWTWSLMGATMASRIEPLADPNRLQPAAAAIRCAIAAGDPSPARIRLEGLPSDSPWPMLLSVPPDGGEPTWSYNHLRVVAPTIALDVDSVDEYLQRRSSHFRKQMRYARRKLENDGAQFRIARTPDELEPAIREFIRLHLARWENRGGSSAMTDNSDRMLLAAGRELGTERFQLVSLVMAGTTINSQLFVAAGNEISYWAGGFDEDYAHYQPSKVTLLEAVRTSIEHGYRRFDLGPGPQEYKYRFSDSEEELLSMTLVPRRRLYAAARLAFAPEHARFTIAARLTREQKDRLRKVVPRRRR
jgi:CelD/BcsL family acetyltransferase involved in cellulose biosynthesis